MNKIRINQGRVVESTYRWMFSLVLVLGMVGAVIGMNNYFGFIVMLFLALMLISLWTSFYMLEIDPEAMTFRESTVVFGKKFGKIGTYDSIESVFINSLHTSQSLHSYGGQSHHMKGREYHAFMKFGNGTKLFLASDEDEQQLRQRLAPVMKKLKTEIRPS